MSALSHIRRTEPIIRVFVSSTFADLIPERDALHQDVFPRLEALCARRGFQFQAIDLRWGVSTEASLDHRTMRICFSELARAQELSPRPNFLILLGDRYGWRPLPELLGSDEYDRLLRAADTGAERQTLRHWYPCDENAIAPAHVLRSRFTDDGGSVGAGDWARIEAVLWGLFNSAFPPEQLSGRFSPDPLVVPPIVRCQASATEQEIWHGALMVPDAAEHVVAWFRNLTNLPEMEGTPGIATFADVTSERGEFDVLRRGALKDLKSVIRQRLGPAKALTGQARLVRGESQGQQTLGVTTDHIGQMCADIGARLSAIARQQMDEYWRGSEPTGTPAQQARIEVETHRRFSEQRAPEGEFIGRGTELSEISRYLNGPSRQPLVVTGPSGSGKTALIARAAALADTAHPVVMRFVGISPQSSELLPLLRSICAELRDHSGEGEPPAEPELIIREFAEDLVGARGALTLFIDGLDGLGDNDNGRGLAWLPEAALASGVKLVISCLADRDPSGPAGEPMAALARRDLWADNFVSLGALEADPARALLFDHWLAGAGRRLTPRQSQQVSALLEKSECRQPLFLRLLFEEVRLWRSDTRPAVLGERMTDLLDLLFDRLCLPTEHGATAAATLGFLAAARRGLAETELPELLYQDSDYGDFLTRQTALTSQPLPAGTTRVPIALCARLWQDLAPYLATRRAPGGIVRTFYHRAIAKHAHTRFVKQARGLGQHARLSEWFLGQSDFIAGVADEPPVQQAGAVTEVARRFYKWIVTGQTLTHDTINAKSHRPIANARKADELPWQLARARKWQELEALHRRISFLEAALVSGLADDIAAGAASASRQATMPATAAIGHAIARTSSILRDRPDLALQTLRNDMAFVLDNQAVSLARMFEHELDRRGAWLRAETGAAWAKSDKSAVWAPRKQSTVQTLSASRDALFVATADGSIEQYRLEGGQTVGARNLGAGRPVWLTASRSGHLAWREPDGRIRVTGGAHELRGRRADDQGAFLGDRHLLTATEDARLVAWNPRTGETQTLRDDLAPRPIMAAVSRDGKHAVLVANIIDGGQFVALVNETPDGDPPRLRQIEPPPVPVVACDISDTGQAILLATLDRGLRVHDSTGNEIKRILYEKDSHNAFKGVVSRCALAPGDTPSQALIATSAGQVGLWRFAAGEFLPLGSHSAVDQALPLLTLSLLGDGERYALSTVQEVRVAPLTAKPTDRPPTSINACALGPDGWAAAASTIGQYIAWYRGAPLVAAGFDHVPHPTAIAFGGADGMLFAGNQEGQVWRQQPTPRPLDRDGIRLFDQPVVSVFATKDGRAVAASQSGAVRAVDFDAQDVSPMLPENPGIDLSKIAACNERGDLMFQSQGKGYEERAENIEIVRAGGRREGICKLAGRAKVEVAPDGDSIVIAHQGGTDLWRQRHGRWRIAYHDDRHIEQFGFLGNDRLAVVPSDRDQWLEIWSVGDGLKPVAAVGLPSRCRTLVADSGRVLVGGFDGSVSLWSWRNLKGAS
jgi:hypothetical protein